jgi:hypothetical protein
MKHNIFIVLSSACVLYACTTESNNEQYLFVIQVDSIAHASTVSVNDTIAIKLYGTIGYNGCYAFSYFDDTVQPLNLDLAVIGELSNDAACPDVMVYLNGKEYRCAATQKGWFKINIRQPDESYLRDSVLVN